MHLSEERIKRLESAAERFILGDFQQMVRQAFMDGATESSSVDGSYGITISGLMKAMRESRYKGTTNGVGDEFLRKIMRMVLGKLGGDIKKEDKRLEIVPGPKFMRGLRFLNGKNACGAGSTKTILRKAKPCQEKDYASLVNKPTGRLCVLGSKEDIRAYVRGEKNEARFVAILQSWRDGAHEFLKSCQLKIKIRQSRKFSKQDMAGEDVRVSVVVSKREYVFVYDVKSSSVAAREFNGTLRCRGYQKYAALKKAIVVNSGRSDYKILQEVFLDISAKINIAFPI